MSALEQGGGREGKSKTRKGVGGIERKGGRVLIAAAVRRQSVKAAAGSTVAGELLGLEPWHTVGRGAGAGELCTALFHPAGPSWLGWG